MKKMPVRTCVVCHEKIEKKQLMRFVCTKEGEVSYDPTGKANGRGAYICGKPQCVDTFLKKNILEKAFKRAIDDEVIADVREKIKDRLS